MEVFSTSYLFLTISAPNFTSVGFRVGLFRILTHFLFHKGLKSILNLLKFVYLLFEWQCGREGGKEENMHKRETGDSSA